MVKHVFQVDITRVQVHKSVSIFISVTIYYNLLTVLIWCSWITDKAKAFPWLTVHDWGVDALADAGVDGEALFLVLKKNSVIWRHPEKKTETILLQEPTS